MNPIMPKPYKLLSVDKITTIEYLFKVEFDQVDKVNFGTFVQVSLPKVGECPISITDFSKEEGWIELLIRKVGVVTDKVFELVPGDTLFLRGPYGNGFNIENYKDKNLIVVAGGSGLAPVRSLIKHVDNNRDSVKSMELLLGFKDTPSIIFKEEVADWRKKFPMTLTVDEGCGLDGECVGLVTKYVPQICFTNDDLENTQVVIVGPPMMMKFTALEFINAGIKKENIWVSFERNMSCAIGKCGHCRIDETYICLEGPVFSYAQGETLID